MNSKWSIRLKRDLFCFIFNKHINNYFESLSENECKIVVDIDTCRIKDLRKNRTVKIFHSFIRHKSVAAETRVTHDLFKWKSKILRENMTTRQQWTFQMYHYVRI